MKSIVTTAGLESWLKSKIVNNRLVANIWGIIPQEQEMILMILKKYLKMIKTKSVIDQDIEVEKLEKLVRSLNE